MSALAASRIVWGGVLVVAPGVAIRLLGGEPATPTWRLVGRVLGVRHLLQAMRESDHNRRSGWADPAVDAVHGVSALSLALLEPRYRRLGALDAIIAACFGVWSTTSEIGAPERLRPSSPVLIGATE